MKEQKGNSGEKCDSQESELHMCDRKVGVQNTFVGKAAESTFPKSLTWWETHAPGLPVFSFYYRSVFLFLELYVSHGGDFLLQFYLLSVLSVPINVIDLLKIDNV